MVNLNDRAWANAGDYVRVGSLLVQGKLIVVGPIPGPGTFKTPPFLYVATGAENPAGFPIPFPTGARGGAGYVATVTGAGLHVLMGLDVIAYADNGITVTTTAQLNAGDKLAVIIGDT